MNDPFSLEIPEICHIACAELQKYLTEYQHTWSHNFGLTEGKTGLVKGKMFGVLVVQSKEGQLGYLCTFSGKLRDNIYPPLFVPSVFDLATNGHFLNKGMTELSQINLQIKSLESNLSTESASAISELKEKRRLKSIGLQEELFHQYQFLNKHLKSKDLIDIFLEYNHKKPPSGAGECTAPKLLHYAYVNKLEPKAIAEFWWGKSTQSEGKVHKGFYAACHDKCKPILGYMLG